DADREVERVSLEDEVTELFQHAYLPFRSIHAVCHARGTDNLRAWLTTIPFDPSWRSCVHASRQPRMRHDPMRWRAGARPVNAPLARMLPISSMRAASRSTEVSRSRRNARVIRSPS